MSLYNKITDLQKLTAAWQRVRRNRPAAGVDNITWRQYDESSREELRNLKAELERHSYAPLPVRNVTLYKGEKARTIALYSMRDKVVQQSMAAELTKLFDGRLSKQCYAYRSERSALQAIEDVTTGISTGAYGAVLKTDIRHFFDTISWKKLQAKLSCTIKEDDVIELIRSNACTAMLDETTGEITEKSLGIHQGSSIAPVLSNIYLMDFDNELTRPGIFYVRYSDDILILGENKEKLYEVLSEIKARLAELCLTLNEDKTICCTILEGVDFLGYRINSSGKSIPAKAEDRLYERLETMWLTASNTDFDEKAAKALEIVGGWQQYYRDERKINSIYEYVAYIFAVGGRQEMRTRLEKERPLIENVCRDIAEYLALYWKKYGREALELLEYEQVFNLPQGKSDRFCTKDDMNLLSHDRQNDGAGNSLKVEVCSPEHDDRNDGAGNWLKTEKLCSLLEIYRKHIVLEGEETATELMQIYTDMQEYSNAQHWMEQVERLKARKSRLASLSRKRGYAGSIDISLPGVHLREDDHLVRAGHATAVAQQNTAADASDEAAVIATAVAQQNTAADASDEAAVIATAATQATALHVSTDTTTAIATAAAPREAVPHASGDAAIAAPSAAQQATESRPEDANRGEVIPITSPEKIRHTLKISEHTAMLMLEAFAGREDIYSTETISGNQHRKTELQQRPLTEAQLEEHLRGGCTYGTYIQRPNSTVRYIVWDVDISKQFILKYGSSGAAFDSCLQKAYHKALEIQKLLDDKGIRSYIEFSGFRGYHVWLFLTEWIPVRFANMLTDRIEEEMALEDDITVECFPNKARLKAGKFGQILKIPYGVHVRSSHRSCFIDDDGQPVTDLDSFIKTLARYPLPTIRKVISYSKSHSGETQACNEAAQESNVISDEEMEKELHAAFGDLTANVKEVLHHCSLMKYLCMKAKRTGYLTHFERMSILYVFGHVGEEGKEFVHDVMRLTMNYQYNTTQRFIERIPEKPISCGKLREQYKKISAEVGCSCSFKRTKNCYPSPVLHALSLSKDVQEDITVPTSRTLSSKKEKTVIEELNVHKKAQELAARILELRKQQRALGKNVSKVERELEKLYDSIGADALEIEMGLLVRRKTQDGVEWIIEI